MSAADVGLKLLGDDEEDDRRLLVIADPRDQPDVSFGPLEGFPTVEASFLAGPSPLGYDVCDAHRSSALAKGGARLDVRHFLVTLDEANALRRDADARVPEHAPFFVVRVFERTR